MTCFGINNEGQLVLDYFHEDHDLLAGANVYNGQNSVLWCNFRDAFPDEIKATYQDLRSNGVLNYDELIDQFITKGSDKWSESIYNEDADFKYISMLYTDGDASNLGQVRGTGEEHLRYFIENRLNYCDGKWYASAYADDYVALRIYTPSTWAGVEPNADITVTPYSHMYAGVRYKANGTLYQKRVSANEVTKFEAPDETFNDTETAIYGASQLSSLGDLSPLYCGSINVSKAEKLTELIIGSDAEGYSNPNLNDLSVGTNNLLKVLNVRNCSSLTDPLALSGCPNIEEIYAAGSGITGIELANSGYLKTIELPATITNLSLMNQLYIESLTLEGYDAIKTIRIENCPTIDGLDILSKATNVERVRLTNVNWTYDTASGVLALADRNLAGIDENGANIDYMWIDGKCHIKTLTGAEYLEVKEAFPYMTITYDSLTAELIFMSEDGNTELTRQTIQNGGDGTDPVTAGTISRPTKESTAQYNFTYSGWSLTSGGVADADALKNVEADRRVYVAFSKELRSYIVRFYNGTTLLQTLTVQYGGDAVYSGSTPVNNSTGNPADFEFYGWSPAPTNIQGDTNCYAQFHDLREITDSWATIAENVANGTATEKYAIGAFKTLDIGEVSLPYEFNQGSAVVYNGEIHILGSVISEYRTSHYKLDGTKWVEVGIIPYEFYYGSAVVYNNEIHILGGSSSSTGRTKHYKWDGSNWTSVSTLPYVFDKGVAIVYNNEIHIMGSRDSSNYTSHYKWNGSAWSEVGELPYSFYTASGFIYNNEIHALGSYDSNYETAHYKYDGSSWTSVSTLPQKLSNGHALVVGTDIYMIQWDEFYKYDGTNWNMCSNVPANVYDGRSVVLDGNIYVMGSSVSENGRVFYSYAPETSTWSKVGITESIPMEVIAHNHDELPDGVMKWENIGMSLPVTQQYGCAVVLNDEIHVLGGNNSSTYTRHTKWDATNSNWVTVSTLPYQFRSGCAIVLNDEIHILGSYQTSNKTEHYKWNGTEWTSVSTLPYAFYCASAVVFNDEIHILGSYNNSNRKSHYKWNGTEWVSVSTLSYNFYYGSAIVYGDEIHIFGGSGASTGHYKWDETNGWTEVSTLPHDFSSGAAGVVNNEIHIFGGSNAPTEHYKYNGTEWVSVSTLPDDFYNSPLAICKDTPYMFIGMTCYKLAGASWELISSKTKVDYLQPSSIVTYNGDVYIIGGIFTPSQIYKFDGEDFTLVTNSPIDTFQYVTCFIYNDELHAIGLNGYKEHWIYDWTEWRKVHTFDYSIKTAFYYNDTLYVVMSEANNEWCYVYKYSDGVVTKVTDKDARIQTNTTSFVYNDLVYIRSETVMYTFDGTVLTKLCDVSFSCMFTHFGELYGASKDTGLYKLVDNGFVLASDVNNSEITKMGATFSYRGHIYTSYNKQLYVYKNPRATLTFLAGNLPSITHVMNRTSLNSYNGVSGYNCGGWSVSQMRSYLNEEFLLMLPTDLQLSIKTVNKLSDSGYSFYDILKTEDDIWLPSYSEMGGTHNTWTYLNSQGDAYSVFTNDASRDRNFVDGSDCDLYYLRSMGGSNHTQGCIVQNKGYLQFAGMNVDRAFLFGFCI